MSGEAKTKMCYAIRQRGIAKIGIDDVGLGVEFDFVLNVPSPVRYKDPSEIIDYLRKEHQFPKPRKIEKVSEIFGEDGRGLETLKVEIGPNQEIRVFIDIYYYLETGQAVEKNRRQELEEQDDRKDN